jgi:protoporphyrin/coproporphyrin ferrochelatase
MTPDAVLLIGFGGPTRPEEIRPFLENVVRGRRVPPERLEEVAHHYEEIGGRSPFNELTFRQAEALRRALAERGRALPVYVGMRNWSPFLADALATMCRDGVRQALGVVLAPHRTAASWEQYHQNVADAQQQVGEGAAAVEYLGPWHTHPGFLEAMAARIEATTGYERGVWPASVPLRLTAHSVPTDMGTASGYPRQLAESAAGIAGLLGAERWSLAYQSRSGDPRQPWLEPDVNDVIRADAAAGVRELVLVPVGFLCDHVEVLYDLDVEARATAAEVGIRLHRAGTVGDHPRFIAMLAELILDHL